MAYSLAAMIRRARLGRKRQFSIRPIQTPGAITSNLAAIMARVPAYWTEAVRERILPAYRTSPLTQDDATDDVTRTLSQVQPGADALVVKLQGDLAGFVETAIGAHDTRWANMVQATTKVDITSVIGRLDAAPEIKAQQQWASSLIKDLSEDARGRVSKTVMQGMASHTPRDLIGKQIAEELGIVRARANRIAADQANKLGGKLDELRHREAGISQYTWHHSGKLHPRLHHLARDGEVYSWSDPPADGHPRTQPYCGCTAGAYIDLLDDPEDD